jgi:hypothetical protein
MSGISASERLRKTATGVCLIVAPLGLLVGLLLHPAESMDPEKQLGIIAADPGRWSMAHYIIAASAVVLAGAVLGLAHLLHERRAGQAIIGGAMGVIGATTLCAIAFGEATFAAQLGRVGSNGAVRDAFSAVMTSPATYVILLGALMGPLGSMVLGSGIFQSDVAPRWAGGALMLGGLCFAVGAPLGIVPLMTIGSAFQLLGMAPIGVMVFGETDEEWMHTPARAVA